MAIARAGVQLTFDAQTGPALAQMAALEAKLTGMQHRLAAKQLGAAMFEVGPVNTKIDTYSRRMDDLTRKIQKGNLAFKDLQETLNGTNGLLEYQLKLHNANVASVKKLGDGRLAVGLDVSQVRDGNRALRDSAVQMALNAAAAKAYGNTLQNLGKNMAFMGRQALLSLTAPIAAIGAGSAIVFYQYDKQLTDIVKLTGDSADAMKASSETIRNESMQLAQDISKNFGVAIKDSLELQGQFSALGKSGRDMAEATQSTARLMRLGDMDADSALKFSNTMSTVFDKTGQDLEDVINLINEMENSTVLTMQDIAEAMPKIGPIVKSFGGDVSDVLTMLEALKRGGIEPVEAANAVKSISTSLLRPTKKLQEMYADMVPGDELMDLIQRNGNDIVKIVKEIGEITADWGDQKRFQLFGQIAGKEQIARMFQLADNLATANQNVTRTLGKSAEELQAIADKEIKEIMASASAQFDVQVQRALAIASRIGADVLPLITKGLSIFFDVIENGASNISGLINALGPLGGVLEGIGKFAIIAVAALGPMMLIASAAALVIGGIYKAAAVAERMRARFTNFRGGGGFTTPKVMTAAEAATDLAMKQQRQAQEATIASTKKLEVAIDSLSASYRDMAGAATRATSATRTVGATSTAAALGQNPSARRFAEQRAASRQESLDRLNQQVVLVSPEATTKAADALDDAEQSSRKLAMNAESITMGIGAAAASASLLVSMMGSAGGKMETIANFAMIASTALMIAPGMVSKLAVAVGSKFTAAAGVIESLISSRIESGTAKGTTKASGAFIKWVKGLGPMLAANAAMLGGIGVAIAGIGMAAYGVYRLMTAEARKFREENDKIRDSVKGWAEVLDFTLLEPGQKRNEQGEPVDTKASRIEAIKNDENLSALVERLRREATNIDKVRGELMTQAITLTQQGLEPKKIKEAIEGLLDAAQIAPQLKTQLMVEFTDFKLTGADGDNLNHSLQSKIDNVMNQKGGGYTASYWQQQGFGSGWLGTGVGGGGGMKSGVDLSQKAKQELDDVMRNMEQSLDASANNPEMFRRVWEQWSNGFKNGLNQVLSDLKPEAAQIIKDKGIMNVDLKSMLSGGQINEDQFSRLMYQQKVLEDALGRLKQKYGDGGLSFMFKDMGDAAIMSAAAMGQAIMKPAEGADKFKAKIASLGDEWKNMDENTKISLLNFYRAASGLEALSGEAAKAAVSAGKFGDQTNKIGNTAADATGDVENLDAAMGDDKEVNWDLVFNVVGVPGLADAAEMTLGGYRDAMQKVQDDMFQAAADNAQANFDSRMSQLKADQDSAMAQLDAEGKAMDARYENESKAMSKAQDAEKESFKQGWDDRIKAEKQAYEDRINAIKDTQDAEDELERQRQRNSEREASRLRYLAGLMNANIDFNVALAGGNLDEAARVSLNQQQSAVDYNTEVTDREAGWRKEDEDRARSKQIDLIREEEDARIEMLNRQKDQEQQAMEERFTIQKEEFDRRRALEQEDLAAKRTAMNTEFQAKQANEEAMFQTNQKRMQMELDTLRATLPRTTAEMEAQRAQIEAIYAKYGIQLQLTGDQWSQIIGNSLTFRVAEARDKMSNDQDWKAFGQRVAEGVSRGAFNMSSGEFNNFLRTGNMPGAAVDNTNAMMPQNTAPNHRHKGGPIGGTAFDKYDSRGGIPRNAPMRSDERYILAQDGEVVINRDAHKKFGTEFFNNINSGALIRHDGGPVGLGVMGAAMQASMIGALTSRATLASGLAMSNAVMGGGYGGGPDIDVGGANGGYGLPPGSSVSYGAKGFPGWVYALASAKGLQASTYPGHQEGDRREAGYAPNPGHLNRGIDWSGPVPSMQGFAEYLLGIAPRTPTLEQIIWMNPGTGQKIGWHGRTVDNGSYFAGDYAGHQDHVHTRSSGPIQPGAAGAPGVGGAPQSSEDIAKKFPQYATWTTAGIQKYGEWAANQFGGAYTSGNDGNIRFDVSAGVEQWRNLSSRMLTLEGQSAAYTNLLLRQMQTESGGNPNAINLWDSNAKAGHPSKGLMQVIDPTFQSHRNPTLANNIWDPAANIAAAIRYTIATYGTLPRGWRGTGYDMGGLAMGRGFMAKATLKPERVLDPGMTEAFDTKLIPILQQLMNSKRGIIGYDSIVTALRNDDGSLANMAKSLITQATDIASTEVREANISLTVEGNVYGVDHLNQILRDFKRDILRGIDDAERERQRRVRGA